MSDSHRAYVEVVLGFAFLLSAVAAFGCLHIAIGMGDIHEKLDALIEFTEPAPELPVDWPTNEKRNPEIPEA